MTAPDPVDLGDFEGIPVRRSTIKITHAGDGLSEALGVDPAIYHSDERVYVVLETTVASLSFPNLPEKEGPGKIRLHTLKAGRATIVDAALVRQLLDAQQARIDEARGIVPLPGMGADDADAGDADVIPIGGAL